MDVEKKGGRKKNIRLKGRRGKVRKKKEMYSRKIETGWAEVQVRH